MFTSMVTAVAAHGAWAGPGFFPLFLIFPFIWILLIGFFIFFGRRMWWRNRQTTSRQGAESVLRERYARGEVDETEYRARLEVLRADHR
ncbi:putative membrane protein [Psychromicrobium silvestre]|uniref:Putative membrane protein n=1 Tax=Psychromicrobium silvestre TaxID=1645614 RepID=A0A7Y9S9M1_9MICC|nr:hypothetical protein [Psychromicrobium silvestre]NYE96457.1 putative membrane protein [Psychromicrobium silvestre]